MRFPPASINSPARLRLAASAGALCAFACLQANEPADYFRLEAGPDLLGYSRVAIRLDDTSGRKVEVLYDDTLPDLKRLEHLPSRRYSGGTARIQIEGFKGSRLAYRESRLYEGRTQRLLDLAIERFGDSGDPSSAAGGGTQGTAPHAPFLSAFPRDTVVSIRDSVPLPAVASDSDGDLGAYAWECGPDGPRDSAVLPGMQAKIRFGVRYAGPGERVCRLSVSDLGKRVVTAAVKITVELDPPWADAGGDTTVPIGGRLLLHARGEDGHGPIVSRAWSIDGGAYRPVPQIETSVPAPLSAGDYKYILKVTDSDSLSALDTLIVHVSAAPAGNVTGIPGSSDVTP
jgi:hypothetical protein